MATATKTTEQERVRGYRLEQYLRMGFDVEQAEAFSRENVDWHEVEQLLLHGCTHRLALRILL
jgi:hypothetical protein